MVEERKLLVRWRQRGEGVVVPPKFPRGEGVTLNGAILFIMQTYISKNIVKIVQQNKVKYILYKE